MPTAFISKFNCERKIAKGNLFIDSKRAKRAASEKTRQVGHKIEWFRCPWCSKWHIGRSSKVPESAK